MIVKFEIFENNTNRKKEIGDYVKLTIHSGFRDDPIVMDNIYIIEDKYTVYDEDDSDVSVIFLKISSIFNEVKLNSVPPYCTKLVTEDEINDMRIKLQAKKYNL